MAEPTGALLRVAPHKLPDLITAYTNASTKMTPLLNNLLRRGRVPEPWTHDPHSENLQWTFNQWAVDAPDSVYNSLVLYQQELDNVVVNLRAMHAEYERTENGVTASMKAL